MMSDLSPKAQVIIDAFDDEYYQKARTRQDALAAAFRVLADELSYTLFLPGNDCRVIDSRAVYDLCNEIEKL